MGAYGWCVNLFDILFSSLALYITRNSIGTKEIHVFKFIFFCVGVKKGGRKIMFFVGL